MSSELLKLFAERRQQFAPRKKILRLELGRGRYRILPSWRGAGSQKFWADFGQHFVKGPDNKVKAIYVCESKTFGKECAVCEAIETAMRNTTDDATVKLLKDAQSSAKVLLNVLHLNGPTPNEVQILEVPPSVFSGRRGVGGLVSMFEAAVKDGYPLPTDLENGFDVIIEKSGSGMETTYSVQAVVKGSNPVDPSVLKGLHNLDEFVSQENAEARMRAINALPGNKVALLPSSVRTLAAPVSPDTPTTPSWEDEDALMTAAVEAPVAKKVLPPMPVEAPSDGVITPVRSSRSLSSGDADLDSLLADLTEL